MTMKFYTSVPKGLKLKVKKVDGLSFTFVAVTGEKLIRRLICSPHPLPHIE